MRRVEERFMIIFHFAYDYTMLLDGKDISEKGEREKCRNAFITKNEYERRKYNELSRSGTGEG